MESFGYLGLVAGIPSSFSRDSSLQLQQSVLKDQPECGSKNSSWSFPVALLFSWARRSWNSFTLALLGVLLLVKKITLHTHSVTQWVS